MAGTLFFQNVFEIFKENSFIEIISAQYNIFQKCEHFFVQPVSEIGIHSSNFKVTRKAKLSKKKPIKSLRIYCVVACVVVSFWNILTKGRFSILSYIFRKQRRSEFCVPNFYTMFFPVTIFNLIPDIILNRIVQKDSILLHYIVLSGQIRNFKRTFTSKLGCNRVTNLSCLN